MNKINQKFLDEKVLQLHKKGKDAAQIGLLLRDLYLVTPVKRLGLLYPYLKTTASELEKDQLNMDALKEHWRKHHHDYKAQRAIQKLKPKIHKLGLLVKRKLTPS